MNKIIKNTTNDDITSYDSIDCFLISIPNENK